MCVSFLGGGDIGRASASGCWSQCTPGCSAVLVVAAVDAKRSGDLLLAPSSQGTCWLIQCRCLALLVLPHAPIAASWQQGWKTMQSRLRCCRRCRQAVRGAGSSMQLLVQQVWERKAGRTRGRLGSTFEWAACLQGALARTQSWEFAQGFGTLPLNPGRS